MSDTYERIHESLARHLSGPGAERYAEGEARKITDRLAVISALVTEGRLSREEAAALIDMQTSASLAVFLAAESIGVVDAQNAITAAREIALAVVGKVAGAIL